MAEGLFSKERAWRGLVIAGVLYAAMFAIHIWLAIEGYRAAFRFSADLITVQTIALGPSAIVLGSIPSHASSARIKANRIGLIIGIPLAVSLAWAYAGMSYDWNILGWVAVTVLIHLVVERRLVNKPVQTESI